MENLESEDINALRRIQQVGFLLAMEHRLEWPMEKMTPIVMRLTVTKLAISRLPNFKSEKYHAVSHKILAKEKKSTR